MSVSPGQSLLHYRVVDKIGEGGMGVVWKAVDSKLDREVAIKILPDSLARDPARLERFKREAKAIAALNHPNIVTIHSIEEDAERRFLVMELIEGDSLDKMIPPDGLPLSRVFEIAIPMATALATAHDRGIVHRDVKPANVMVTGDGHVKMLDFGLAKLATGGAGENFDDSTQVATQTAGLTGENVVLGTAPYMSPEQLQGLPVDRRTDIFSLGVVLYEMVTGERPFTGASGLDLASAILKDTPAPVTESRNELPRHLERIIEHCLEKKPDHRFQTARDVGNQLAALRRETESGVSSGSGVVRAGSGRRKWLFAAMLALAIVGPGGFFLWRAMSPSGGDVASVTGEVAAKRKVIVVLPFENLGAPEDEYFADGMTEEIHSRLATMRDLAVISRNAAMQYKGQRPSTRRIADELGVDYILTGTVRWQSPSDGPSRVRVTPQLIEVSQDTSLWAEPYERVLADIFDVQSDIAVKVSEQLGIALHDLDKRSLEARPTENLEAYDALLRGNDYLNRGMDLGSADELRFAIQMYERAVELDPEFALAHARISAAHSWLYGEYRDPTESRATAARQAANRAIELDPQLPEAHFALGQIYTYVDEDPQRALDEFRTVLESQPSNAFVYEAMSELHQKLGRWDLSLEDLTKARELQPRLGRLACWSGGSAFGLRDFEKAIRDHERAIELTPDRACPYFCMARIYLNRDGNTEQARRFLEALPTNVALEDNPPINYPWVLLDVIDERYDDALARLDSGPSTAYSSPEFYIPKDLLRARVHLLQGRPELARSHYELARTTLEAALAERPDDPRLHGSLGIAYAGLGRAAEAIREGQLSLELLHGARDEQLGRRIRDMAEIYTMVGDREQAIDQLEELLSVPAFFSSQTLRADPTWRDLRADPRFRSLLDKHG